MMLVLGNKLPNSAVICSSEEVVHWIISSPWAKRMEYTQLLPGYLSCHVIHNGQGQGVCIVETTKVKTEPPVCYKFSECEHVFDVEVLSVFHYRETCRKCKLQRDFDSGDCHSYD